MILNREKLEVRREKVWMAAMTLSSTKKIISIIKSNNIVFVWKTSLNIYADLECIIEKIDGCKNNLQNLSTANASEHIPSGFSMSTILPLNV